MNLKAVNHRMISFRFASLSALFAGLFGLLVLLLPDMDLVGFLFSAGVMGLLFAGDQYYTETDRQRIRRSAVTAFQGLFLVMLAAYAFIALARQLHAAGEVVEFLNLHWPVLTALVMCILTGIGGLRSS